MKTELCRTPSGVLLGGSMSTVGFLRLSSETADRRSTLSLGPTQISGLSGTVRGTNVSMVWIRTMRVKVLSLTWTDTMELRNIKPNRGSFVRAGPSVLFIRHLIMEVL